MNELELCTCGCKPNIVVYYGTWFIVRCRECGKRSETKRSAESVIDAWNRQIMNQGGIRNDFK